MKKEAGNRVHISFQINFTSGNKKIILKIRRRKQCQVKKSEK